MAAWKLLLLAPKARRAWRRIPPAQRRKMMDTATKHGRTYGPLVAKRLSTLAKNARKAR